MPFTSDFITKNINDTWAMLMQDLKFCSKWFDKEFVVKSGFVTDFASVPRLPFIYMFMGGRGKRPATLHDSEYAKQEIPKRQADLLFLEGLLYTFVHDAVKEFVFCQDFVRVIALLFKILWRSLLAFFMYLGVVIGGWPTWLRYRSRRKKGLPLRPEAPEVYDDRWEDRVY